MRPSEFVLKASPTGYAGAIRTEHLDPIPAQFAMNNSLEDDDETSELVRQVFLLELLTSIGKG
jgi:hypothetical protein